nr:hypothetical protein [Exiguobacterium sp. S3-2]
MEEVRISFNFTHDINQKEYALKMLALLKKYEIEIEKIGSYEPIKKIFSEEAFVKMWTEGEDDFFSIIARLKKSKSYINFHNLKGGLIGNVGFIFVTSEKKFKKEEKWIQLFYEICRDWSPHRAFISKRFPERDIYMYETGFSRPKEVEWMNYWSNELLSKDLRNSLLLLNWYKIIELNKGYLYQLTADVDDDDVYFMSEHARQMVGEELLYRRSEDLDDLED